jgi:hypothetical protein
MNILCILLFLLIPFPSPLYASKDITLSKAHKIRIERLAQRIADDISLRGIKTVEIGNFTDLKGRSQAFEKAITLRFKKALIRASKGRFSIVDNKGEILIKGTVLPYKEKERFDLKIDLTSDGTVLSSYSSIFKE